MSSKITKRDQSSVREWKNVREASVDKAGDVWVCDPCVGHWLSAEAKAEFVAWRESMKVDPAPQTRHHIFMPPEMMARLRQAKERTGVPVAEFIRRAIETALKDAGL
jgi:hypothetical protein